MLKRVSLVLLTFMFVGCQSTPHQGNTQDRTTASTQPKHQEYLHAGDKLPIEMIERIDGKKINLKSLKKRKIVILFATWCHDSNRLIKALNKTNILHDDAIEIIAIARGETKQTVATWRDKFSLDVPFAVDTDQAIYKQFASGGIPRIITVDENNHIIKMNLAEGYEQLSLIEWQ